MSDPDEELIGPLDDLDDADVGPEDPEIHGDAPAEGDEVLPDDLDDMRGDDPEIPVPPEDEGDEMLDGIDEIVEDGEEPIDGEP